VDEHAPHAPEGWHAGVAPAQSASDVQARQVWVASSQVGVVPPQDAADTHATHVPVAASHAGVVPPQSV
jgi:hypothetical protein